jgi:hypothetical protein
MISFRCLLSVYPENFDKADLIIFHAPTRDQSNPSFPANKNSRALNVLVSMEQPKYAPILSNPQMLKSFDLMLTYSSKAFYSNTNIPNMAITYYPLNILSPASILQSPRPFKEKTGFGTGAFH